MRILPTSSAADSAYIELLRDMALSVKQQPRLPALQFGFFDLETMIRYGANPFAAPAAV